MPDDFDREILRFRVASFRSRYAPSRTIATLKLHQIARSLISAIASHACSA